MARIEFPASLYLHNREPCLPGDLIEAALIEGAKKRKRGKQTKAGLLCDGNYPLIYEGPRPERALIDAESVRQKRPTLSALVVRKSDGACQGRDFSGSSVLRREPRNH